MQTETGRRNFLKTTALATGLLTLSGMASALADSAAASKPTTNVGSAQSETKNTVLLFSFFRDNGQDGLYLAWSHDGLKWEELKPPSKSFLQPKLGDKLMRDPCLQLGSDGMFRMVWTTSWTKLIIGYASSRDLLQWSEQKAIPVMTNEPTARNCWAPELFHDETKQQWLIYWSTTIPGRFPETEASGNKGLNHRMYSITTKDFETFSPTKLFYDGGFNVIDGTLLRVGDNYHLIVKDETLHPAKKKHLRITTATAPDGPWGLAGAAFTTSWVEGPSAIQIGDEYFVYFDHYAKPHYYGAMKSPDLKNWEDISGQMKFPAGIRHGTVLRVPQSVVDNIIDHSTKQ